MAREEHDVGASIAERRHLHGHDGEAVIEVLAKSSGANRGGQILARRREHPRVGRLGARAAKATDRMIVERLEQLGLQRVRHQPDLVEEDRAAMSDLKKARFGLLGVGERAALEPEELGLEQRVGNRRTVHVNEGRRRPRAHLMDDVCDQPLAGSCFSLNQDRGESFERNGRACQEASKLVPHGRQRRAHTEQLLQHVLILSKTRGESSTL